MSMSIFCTVDDKHVPLFRVIWISATPHYCGEDDCMREGSYEVRLEQGESVWATSAERDRLVERMEQWQGGLGPEQCSDEEGDLW